MKTTLNRRLGRLEESLGNRGYGIGFVCIEPGETEEEAIARDGIARVQCSTLYIMDL